MNPNLKESAKLVNHTDAGLIKEWEFGNEPSGTASDGKKLGMDFVSFRQQLSDRFGAKAMPKLVGPDVGYGAWHESPETGNTKAFLDAFSAATGSDIIDGATVHIYPFDHNDV